MSHAKSTPKAHHDDKKHAPHAHICISGSGLSPDTFNAKVGSPVKWTNEDDVPHTVQFATSTNPAIIAPPNSPELAPSGEYEYTFVVPGDYQYCLKENENLKGRVVVS